jgi:hypothetical protein
MSRRGITGPTKRRSFSGFKQRAHRQAQSGWLNFHIAAVKTYFCIDITNRAGKIMWRSVQNEQDHAGGKR